MITIQIRGETNRVVERDVQSIVKSPPTLLSKSQSHARGKANGLATTSPSCFHRPLRLNIAFSWHPQSSFFPASCQHTHAHTSLTALLTKGPSFRHKEQTCGCQGGGGGRGMDWEFGISRCKLLYTGWIDNKVLLYSTGNYIQYLMIKHNGKKINTL